MADYNDVKNLTLTTDANTNKNYATVAYTFSSASVSVANNSYVLRTFSIPLSTTTRFFNILVNMSDEDSAYHPVDRFERKTAVGAGTMSWALQLTTSGSTAILSIYLVNTNISPTTTFPAFTVNVIRRDFVDEV